MPPPVAQAIRAPAGREGLAARIRNGVAGSWHYLRSHWTSRCGPYGRSISATVIRCCCSILSAPLRSSITRLATISVLSLIDRGFRIRPEILQRFPGLEARANRYLPLLRKIVSAVISFVGFLALLEIWGVDAIVWFYGGQIGSRCCQRS